MKGEGPELHIHIHLSCSEDATIQIDDRVFRLERDGCATRLIGIKSPETDNCFGGILASELFPKVNDIEKAWMELDFPEPFETLDEIDAEEAHDQLML